jgi:hypothetical protein
MLRMVPVGARLRLLSVRKRMSYEKTEPGRVAPEFSGRYGPARIGKCDIHYLGIDKLKTDNCKLRTRILVTAVSPW